MLTLLQIQLHHSKRMQGFKFGFKEMNVRWKKAMPLGIERDGKNRVERMEGGRGSLASIVSQPIIHVGFIKTK